MGKKMKKFPFLFKPSETTAAAATTTSAAASWPWPACANTPKTLSFRASPTANIYKTMNSSYNLHDDINDAVFSPETPGSFLSFCKSFERHEICESEHQNDDESEVIRGLRSSDRLFFEPDETSSILEVAKSYDFPYKESVEIMAMDSRDPFVDFRVSMEEMVAAHGLKDWDGLEELLSCYLRVNGKSNHGYIVGAFIDLLLNLDFASGNGDSASDSAVCSVSAIDEPCSSSSNTTPYSFTSPLSFLSSSTCSSSVSPCLSSMANEDEIVVEKSVDSSSSSSSSSSS